ncbi:hypothetical protein GL50803_003141 [Giardia duodenalis]|uniref:Uncharacterized protein n=1 Tax=Giardia intestinalis (strain ATCC 50803 / WB clone C6) TaxID=184922 RepID=D3KGE3_GIAIC|nr:hypothetical protein GL50803_003141 [Giardia intestinalis]KAE8305001.1 hypothetical protein GL50803_003141 [Giardia intestinalis]
MQNGAEKRLGRPESRSESRKTPETEHQRVLQDDASRKSSIASVVKDRASERARAHILSILREAIHKMELENRSHLLKSTGDDYESERETIELVNAPARRAPIRSRTAQSSHKRPKSKPMQQRGRRPSKSTVQTPISASATLTTSALKTPKRRAKSAECRSTSSQHNRKLEVSIASLQAENTVLESQLKKLEEQLLIERQERVDLESRLTAIEKSAGINLTLTLDKTTESRAEVPKNSPSEDKITIRETLTESQYT